MRDGEPENIPLELRRYLTRKFVPELSGSGYSDPDDHVWVDRRTWEEVWDDTDWYAVEQEGKFDPVEVLAGDLLEDMVGTMAARDGWDMLAERFKAARERRETLDPEAEAREVSKLVDQRSILSPEGLEKQRAKRAEWKRKGEEARRLREMNGSV